MATVTEHFCATILFLRSVNVLHFAHQVIQQLISRLGSFISLLNHAFSSTTGLFTLSLYNLGRIHDRGGCPLKLDQWYDGQDIGHILLPWNVTTGWYHHAIWPYCVKVSYMYHLTLWCMTKSWIVMWWDLSIIPRSPFFSGSTTTWSDDWALRV